MDSYSATREDVVNGACSAVSLLLVIIFHAQMIDAVQYIYDALTMTVTTAYNFWLDTVVFPTLSLIGL